MDKRDKTSKDTIAINPSFNTVARNDFAAMLDSERYLSRSGDFETLITRTNEHFWDPLDPDYIDFATPVDREQPLIPFSMIAERHSAIWDKLDEEGRIRFTNEFLRLQVSGVLHGEQGALSLSTGLADMFLDPGAQEYALNQAREEGRHVHAFALYMKSRFGSDVMAPTPTIERVLKKLVATDVIYEKLIGMQMVLEGLAMGVFTSFYQQANDPLLRRLAQLVMTDEAFHHRFGIMWARQNVPGLGEELSNELEDYALAMFNDLVQNLIASDQKLEVYRRCGLDPEFCMGAMAEAMSTDKSKEMMREGSNLFRTLIKTLWRAGLITERTRPQYAFWVDMNEIVGEGEQMIGDDIAEAGIQNLVEINAGKKRVVKRLNA